MNNVRARVAIVTALLAVGIPVAAGANTGGVRIILQQWNPMTPTIQKNDIVFDKPGLIGDALDQGWAQARTPVCDALKAEAGQPNRLGAGFSLYNIQCAMAPSGTLAITSAYGNIVEITYRLVGNTFKATSTQPTAAGSYADPCASFRYDLAAKTTLHLDTLAVDTFHVSTENVSRPDSCNTAGDIALFASSAVRFFGGPDFVGLAQHAIERTQSVSTAKLNVALAAFVTPVQQYAARFAVQQRWVRHGDLYFAFAPDFVPQRSQAMSGSIHIAKNQWMGGVPDCTTFSVSGYVQTGPNPIVDPERMSTGTAPGLEVGVTSTSGTGNDVGDRYECAYTERQLPSGAPVHFLGHAKAPASRGHVQDTVGLAPEGWNGNAMLNGDLANKNFTATLAPSLVGFGEKVNLGARLSAVDPAQTATLRTDPASRVSLNPQPLPPKVADAVMQSGLAAFSRRDFTTAADAFARSYAANPKNAIALHDLALAHMQLGQTDLAKSEFQRASQLAKSQNDFGTSRASESAIIIVSGRH